MSSRYICRSCQHTIIRPMLASKLLPRPPTPAQLAAHVRHATSSTSTTITTPSTGNNSNSDNININSKSNSNNSSNSNSNTSTTTTLPAATTSPLAMYEQAQVLGALGKRVAVVDEHGERHVLACVPPDVRTYRWSTASWSWGVLERLFQDCERAKPRFALERFVDEVDGKTRERVVRDADGMHVGEGEGWFFDVLELPKTFNTWVAVCFLHMWILKTRIRNLPPKMSRHWNELLTNHFFWECEKTMDFDHKVDATSRKKYLDEYFQVWTASILAYDEGLLKGDAVLGTAVWRLLFNSEPDTEPHKISLVVGYIRREVARIGQLEDKILARGYVGFGKPFTAQDH